MKDQTAESHPPHLLKATTNGVPCASEELLPLVYEHLRHLAARRLAGEHQEHTLQPTALVHEAWIKIAGQDQRTWQGRQQFLAAAAEAMRRILVDRARRRQTLKRGQGIPTVPMDPDDLPEPLEDETTLALDGALTRLAQVHPSKAELIKLRYFAGLSFAEAAEVLGIAVPTAKQWWTYARAWLRVEITREP